MCRGARRRATGWPHRRRPQSLMQSLMHATAAGASTPHLLHPPPVPNDRHASPARAGSPLGSSWPQAPVTQPATPYHGGISHAGGPPRGASPQPSHAWPPGSDSRCCGVALLPTPLRQNPGHLVPTLQLPSTRAAAHERRFPEHRNMAPRSGTDARPCALAATPLPTAVCMHALM